MFNLFKKGSEDTATEETDGFDPDRVTVHYEGEVMSPDRNNIHQKAQDDMQVKFLSGDVDYTNQYVDECNADMLAILKEEYIPNFFYMGK